MKPAEHPESHALLNPQHLQGQLQEGWALVEHHASQALGLADGVLLDARRLNHPAGTAQALHLKGAARAYRFEFDAALEDLQLAMEMYRAQHDAPRLAEALVHTAMVYGRMEQFEAALDGQQRALNLARQHRLPVVEALALEHLGGVLAQLDQHEQALEALQSALALQRQHRHVPAQVRCLAALGDVHHAMGHAHTALQLQHEALSLANQTPDAALPALPLMGMAALHLHLGDAHLAESALDRALAALPPTDLPNRTRLHLLRHRLFAALNEPLRALEEANLALACCKKLQAQSLQAACHRAMAETYRELGQWERALEQQETHGQLYAGALKQHARQTFRSLQRYHSLEQAEHERERERQRNLELADALQRLGRQQDEVADALAQLHHSIAYASRLQHALLPHSLPPALGEHFVLWKPRDGVSGDLYWTETLPDGKVLLAVADCTGHGVPGALIGMLAYAALNAIVRERGYSRPDKVLKLLDLYVRQTLNHNRGQHQVLDGLDMGLVRWDPQSRMLEFAGAFHPLVCVRQAEALVLKGDRMPVGGPWHGPNPLHPKPFGLQRLQVQPGDALYMFSDGFADQFGGPPGNTHKYGPKRLRNLLCSLHELPLHEQHMVLEYEWLNHRGPEPPTDDVLMVGWRP